LIEISDVLINREIDDSLDNLINIINNYREKLHEKVKGEFERINLIKSFKHSIEKYKYKLNDLITKYSGGGSNKNISSGIILNELNKKSFSTNETNILSNLTEDNIDTNFLSEQINTIPIKEQIDIKREIEFIELYNLTLKKYSKDFYNPCNYFFINKFQNNKLEDDLNRILMKTCDFDENVDKYNLNKLNNGEEKSILKDV